CHEDAPRLSVDLRRRGAGPEQLVQLRGSALSIALDLLAEVMEPLPRGVAGLLGGDGGPLPQLREPAPDLGAGPVRSGRRLGGRGLGRLRFRHRSPPSWASGLYR